MQLPQRKIGVLLSYLSIGLNGMIQLCYTPIMLRLLGQSEYGLYTLVCSVVGYLGLLSFGMVGAYIRFYSRFQAANDKQKIAQLNGMFMTVFLVLAAIALAAGLTMSLNVDVLLGSRLTEAELNTSKVLLSLLSLNLAISFPDSVFTSYITAHEQFFFQRLLNLTKYVLNPFLALPLLLLGYGSIAMVLVTTGISIAALAVNIWFCIQKLKMEFSLQHIQWRLLLEIAGFSFFIFINSVIDQVNWNVDKFIIGRFWGTNEVAVYGLGSQINTVYLAFSTAISSVFVPHINRIVAQGEQVDRRITNLFIKVGRIQLLILAPLLCGLILLGKPFLLWMGGSIQFADAYPVMLWLIIPVTIPLIQNLGITIQQAKNQHQFRSIVYALIAGVNILISIPLCRQFGAVGCAMGTAIALILGNVVIMNWYYHFRLGINISLFLQNIIKLVPAFIPTIIYCVICGLTIDLNQPLHFLLTGTGLLCIYCGCVWMFGLNTEEKMLIRSPIRQLIHKGKAT